MSKKRICVLVLTALVAGLLWPVPSTWGQPPDENDTDIQTRQYWGELMHYALIGRLDMAEQYGRALLELEPDPVILLELAESDRYANSYRHLALIQEQQGLQDVIATLLKLVEEGRFLQRIDAERIAAEVKRLSSTTRGRMLAMRRLKDSGQWAVPVMIEALRDQTRTDEFAVISHALPQLGQAAVNPLVVVLQQCRELNVRLIVLEALGKIGYHSAAPYVREIIENEPSDLELKNAALTAFRGIDPRDKWAGMEADRMFEQLAADYYNHLSSLAVPANQDYANVWFWNDRDGLTMEKVDRDVFDELMTMRCCEDAVRLNPGRSTAISLWLSAFVRFEAEGHDQPDYFGDAHADAGTYALTAGPEYLHRVLARALENRNRPVALAAITALRRNSGQQSLLYEVQGRQPLLAALRFGDREVRFSAALAIAGSLPSGEFDQSEQVVPILAEALRQKGDRYALLVDPEQDRRNRLMTELTNTNQFAEIVADEHFAVAIERARGLVSFDLIVLANDIRQPDVAEALKIIQTDYRLAFCPTIVMCKTATLPKTRKLYENQPFVEVILTQTPATELVETVENIMDRNQAWPFDRNLADAYATEAARVLRELALTGNNVLTLKPAESALIEAVRELRPQIQVAATQTLGRLNSVDAQRAVATLALDEQVELVTRLMALRSLAISAKTSGNLLQTEQVDTLYEIVRSRQVDVELRNLAAEAYGALNLPSARISRLILEQSVGRLDEQ